MSDNGPQLASAEMKEFSKEYDFAYITSSPRLSRSNGQAERAVQIAKNIPRQYDPLLLFLCWLLCLISALML